MNGFTDKHDYSKPIDHSKRSWNRADPPLPEKLRRLTTFGKLSRGDAFELNHAVFVKCTSSLVSKDPTVDAACVFYGSSFSVGVRYQFANNTEVHEVLLRLELGE